KARIYVANANSDTLSIIDPLRGAVVGEIATTVVEGAPPVLGWLRGSNPNAVGVAPDERTLYVTNGGNNTLAVVALDGDKGRVAGLVPTGFYPHAVSVSRDGAYLYVAHGKSPTGPNPGGPWSDKTQGFRSVDPGASNQYAPQLTYGGLVSFPRPTSK